MKSKKVLFIKTVAEINKRFPTHTCKKHPIPLKMRMGKMPQSKPRPMWRNAAQFQVRYPQWIVCHGQSPTSDAKGIAKGWRGWLQNGNKVLDLTAITNSEYFLHLAQPSLHAAPITKKYLNFVKTYAVDAKRFYAMHGIKNARPYTKGEIHQLMKFFRHYGPFIVK